ARIPAPRRHSTGPLLTSCEWARHEEVAGCIITFYPQRLAYVTRAIFPLPQMQNDIDVSRDLLSQRLPRPVLIRFLAERSEPLQRVSSAIRVRRGNGA